MKYEIIIFWSNVDECYIATVPELEGCSAWGDTYEEALAQAKTAINGWIEVAKETGETIPEPKGKLVYI